MESRLMRTKGELPSFSSPKALVKTKSPSLRKRILSVAPRSLAQASITYASFVARQAMVSTPCALIASCFSRKPANSSSSTSENSS